MSVIIEETLGSISTSGLPEVSTRRQLLTVEQVASIRTTDWNGRGRVFQYTTAEGTVSATYYSPSEKVIDSQRGEIISFLKAIQHGEGYRYESLVVNSLFAQLEVARKFGLSTASMLTDIRLNVEDKGTILFDHTGDLYLRVLDEHVALLRGNGATEDQITTEVSGHLFHEAVHNAEESSMQTDLLNGRDSFGEITSVTAQVAYYLEEGYVGPTSYDIRRFKAGLDKIRRGKINILDYDIATYVGLTLLLQSLTEVFPDLTLGSSDINPYTECCSIIVGLPSTERQKLIPALKKAIAHSADEKVFETIMTQAKQEKLAEGSGDHI